MFKTQLADKTNKSFILFFGNSLKKKGIKVKVKADKNYR